MSATINSGVFGSLNGSPKVIDVLSKSPVAVLLLNEYRNEIELRNFDARGNWGQTPTPDRSPQACAAACG